MKPISSVSAIEIARRKTLLIVLAADVLLIALTMVKGYPAIWGEFEREQNAWTLANSIQAVLVSVAAYISYLLLSARRNDPVAKSAWVWGLLCFVFLFFAFDDMLILHERGGHAIENAAPFLSRSQITIYMDDVLELLYCLVGAVFGAVFVRRVVRGRNSLRLYMYGVAAMFVATCIGLNPAVKSIPFPLAVIQVLQLLSLYFFFSSFINSIAAEATLMVAEHTTVQQAPQEAVPRA